MPQLLDRFELPPILHRALGIRAIRWICKQGRGIAGAAGKIMDEALAVLMVKPAAYLDIVREAKEHSPTAGSLYVSRHGDMPC